MGRIISKITLFIFPLAFLLTSAYAWWGWRPGPGPRCWGGYYYYNSHPLYPACPGCGRWYNYPYNQPNSNYYNYPSLPPTPYRGWYQNKYYFSQNQTQ